MKGTFLLLSIVGITCLLAPKANAQGCDGNACSDVNVTFDGQCYHAKNHGSKHVKVQLDLMSASSSVSKVLAPGEDWRPQVASGACVNVFKGNYHANYANATASTSNVEMKLPSSLSLQEDQPSRPAEQNSDRTCQAKPDNFSKHVIPGVSTRAGSASCVCYCGGQNWNPGAIACMGGFKYVCADRGGNGTNCGWDPVKSGPDQVPCDGGEHCK